MRILRGEEGAALVTALMLTMLSLVMAMALLYTVTMGTRVSASQKRYHSALAAAQGGVELLTREIVPRLFQSADPTQLLNDFQLIGLQLPGASNGCLQQKLIAPSANWNLFCSAAQSSADPAEAPDMTFTLSGLPSEPGFSVSSKIVDAVPGNSDKSSGDGLLDPGISVSGGGDGSIIHPQHVPGLYSIAVQGVGEGAARGKARLSLLYAY